jgi:uncharacterized iron-regulated membrane protein
MNKLAVRRAWFQVHKWIGLILAILIIPISLTGAALVWHDALDRTLNADRYATSGRATLPVDSYAAAAAKTVRPGDRLASLRMPEHPGDPVVIAATPQAKSNLPGPALRTNVYLDPPTAKVLVVAGSRSGPVMVMHMIHGTLMVPGVGRSIVGWIGVAMVLSSFTGLWLWWPTVGKWARGLRWRRHRNIDSNLHHQLGFWIALPLFVLSLTGAWISFPGFFGPLVGESGRPMGYGADRAAMMRAKPLPAQATSLAVAAGKAQALAPGAITQVSWPTDYKPAWLVTIKGRGKPATVAVDDATGVASAAPSPDRGQSGTARLMRRIHDGTGMGLVWQVIITLGGLLPAVLAVTGNIMWWRARGWKAALAAKQRERQMAAAE